MNTNSTNPMVNSTFLCIPDEYAISLTMAVVKKRTELNGIGRFTELPATKLIAIASPIARPTPKTIAVIMPDFAAGSIVLNIVCILDAPSARDADFIWEGTALIADSLILITVGNIIIANTTTADSRLDPPVNWWVFDPENIVSSNLYISGVSMYIPSKPYTTEGIPAKSSTAGFTIAASLLGATSAKKIAVKIPIGTPTTIANTVPTMEVRITYNIPNEGSAAEGFQTVPKSISVIPTSKSAGVPFQIIYTVIDTTANTAKKAKTVNIICAACSTHV